MDIAGRFCRTVLVVLALLSVGWAQAQAAESWVEPKSGLEFVKVAGGCYTMGQAESEEDSLARLRMPFSVDLSFGDELPRQEVCVDDFNMGQYEVTVSAFKVFVEETGYVTEAEKQGGCQEYRIRGRYRWKLNEKLNWRNPGFSQKDDEPVVCVSWNDSNAFTEWLGKSGDGRRFRLPTEAEWEFAARESGQGMKYAAENDLAKVGWFEGNSPRRTTRVGSLKAGELSIYDLSGNVWEWVADFYAPNYRTGKGKNPSGPEAGQFRVTRGGGWNSKEWSCRVANRDRILPTHRDTNQGFRVVFTR